MPDRKSVLSLRDDDGAFNADAFTPLLVVGAVVFVSLWMFGDNYLLFHTFAELIFATVALVVFSLAWHTRTFAESDYLTFLGMAIAPVALVTILHALAFRGMPLLPEHDTDLPTQLWLIARIMQATAFVIAPVFLTRRLRSPGLVLASYSAFALLCVAAALANVFPAAFIEGQGLTPFKIGTEYVVMALTALAALLLARRGTARLTRPQVTMLVASMAATIVAEMLFTLYRDPFGLTNRLGHVAHLTSVSLLYIALVQTSLEQPVATLFNQLKQRERALSESYEAEHVIAETLQNAMSFQPERVAGLELAHTYLPAPGEGRIGGDFYDLFKISRHSVGFMIGDVCGKGLAAATTTVKARSATRALAFTYEEPSEVLEAVNSYLCRELEDNLFVTAVFGVIDTQTGRVRVAIAGHPDPIVCGRPELTPPHDVRSQPLGVLDPLGVRTWEFDLLPGEGIVLVTDGLIEAPGRLDRFGTERLHTLLHETACGRSAQDIVNSVIAQLESHTDEGLADDVAVVAMRFEPVRPI